MHPSWRKLLDCLLRPARPRLAWCLDERERHLDSRRSRIEARASAIKACEARIEAARAEVFAANDGVVGVRMTELEREWRRLSRTDPDEGMMDLWARIAPRAWIDRKRWRDSAPAARLDAAIALASDVDGVEAAEAAVAALVTALAAHGIAIDGRVRWTMGRPPIHGDRDRTADLLAGPLDAARAVASTRDGGPAALERARRLEEDVRTEALARFPDRPGLAEALGRAASVDLLWRAFSLEAASSPAAPLCDLWRTGYVVSGVDDRGVTLEIPPLENA